MKKIGLFLFTTLLISATVSAQRGDSKATSEKFNTLLYYIESMYVDSTDTEALVEHAIQNLLEELDPHSVYISKEELREANEPLNGSFEGIGVQFNIVKDTIYVITPISGGPSEKLGIRAGDKIIEVEGEAVAGVGITNNDVRRLLKGPKGTRVNVGIQRKGMNDLLDFTITRDKIPIFSVDATFMIDDDIGYIKVNRFAKTTMLELRESMAELKEAGMKQLILDLQGNGGGLLSTAIDMADEFLSDDKLIVYTEGRTFPREDTRGKRDGNFEKGNLIVLVDEGSASASEIVSGAVQDWDRGLIVGRRSFGKGLVQRPVPLPDGSAVRLTVQKYYTPSGRCIQKPYEDGVDAYRSEKYERYLTGELLSMEGIDLPDSLRYETKLKKRSVYGGGGILPDIFVPIDTTYQSDFFSAILRAGITNEFALNFVDPRRDELAQQFTTMDDFLADFEVSENMMLDLVEFAKEQEIEYNAEQYALSEFAIKTRVKALIGRNLYDYSAFYQVVNVLNPSYRKAVEILQDGSFKKMNLAFYDF
jgi:carboxyl-terminal processing protease